MKYLLLLLLLCAGCDQKPEQEEERFKSDHMARFTITRESTPFGYPDLYLIKDSLHTNEVLVVSFSGHMTSVTLNR